LTICAIHNFNFWSTFLVCFIYCSRALYAFGDKCDTFSFFVLSLYKFYCCFVE